MERKINKIMNQHTADEIRLLITELKILLDQAVLDDNHHLMDTYALRIALLRKDLNDITSIDA